MVRSNVPTIDNIIINNLGDNSLEIIAMGDGVLEYSIDGIDFQNNSFFENLIGGSYTVIVRDIEGCGQDMQIVNILDYPRYFTPNNDGFHDFWQLLGISSDLDAKIFIYDRFGKLLKQLAPQGNGWDGNYNGNPLPSDTYWFEVVLSNKNSFKGYFALKR